MSRAPTVSEVVESDGGQKFLASITTAGLAAPFAGVIRLAGMQNEGYSHGVRVLDGTQMEIPATFEIEVSIVGVLALLGMIAAHNRN